MKTTINLHQFRQAFKDMGRGEQFSYDGLRVLFNYLEDYEDQWGGQLELDVIALCCEYSEGTPEQIAEDYGYTFDEEENDNEETRQDAIIDFISDKASVCGVTDSGTIVYQQF